MAKKTKTATKVKRTEAKSTARKAITRRARENKREAEGKMTIDMPEAKGEAKASITQDQKVHAEVHMESGGTERQGGTEFHLDINRKGNATSKEQKRNKATREKGTGFYLYLGSKGGDTRETESSRTEKQNQ